MNPVELPMIAPQVDASGPTPDREAARFAVTGMDCAACAQTVEKVVSKLEGVRSAQVSFGSATLLVDGDLDAAAVQAAVAKAGYGAHPAGVPRPPQAPFWRRDRRTISTTASVVVLLAAVIASLAAGQSATSDGLYLASMLLGGWPIARSALAGLATRSLDMNVLMASAAIGAVAIGDYGEGAWVLVLFAVGTTLETYALDRSRRSVEHLMELAPAEAHLVEDGGERTVPVDSVPVGARVIVRPGERVPLDGTVSGGRSSIDESPLTGESVPVDKEPGDQVFAGTLNAQGALTVEVTAVAAQSTIARVAQLVADAQGSKAPSERFVDTFARIYTPIVFVAAILLAVVPIAFGGEPDTWIYRALALLIVACPCALVISIPVSVVSAIGGAARMGVLVKSGQALEDLGHIRAVALDKTGTLTLGRPALTSIVASDGTTEPEALYLMASLERGSEHPLAAAIVREAVVNQMALADVQDFEALPGRGATGTVGKVHLWAGGPRLAADRGAALPATVAEFEARGETAIVLGEDDRVLAVFGLADEQRPEARDAVRRLIERGIAPVMLTGDSERVAASVSERVGLTEWRAGLLPEDKLAAIHGLSERHGPTAMVGDGINDAPALAGASVGIAMGAAGSDIALETADVALMGDELDRLPDAIFHSQRALKIMRQNVIVSLGTKTIFVLLAPLGMVTLVTAIAADLGVSLLVTLNGLRLLGKKPPSPETAAPTDACADDCCTPPPAADEPVALPRVLHTPSPPDDDACCAPKR